MTHGLSPVHLVLQLLGMICVTSWSLCSSGLLFFVLAKSGLFRVPPTVEIIGLDYSHHGGYAYYLKDMSVRVELRVMPALIDSWTVLVKRLHFLASRSLTRLFKGKKTAAAAAARPSSYNHAAVSTAALSFVTCYSDLLL